jgi:hypothetical protein
MAIVSGSLTVSTDKDDALKHTKQPTPKRPRRFFFPVIVVCILLRLELFYYTSSQQQCTSAGVEVSHSCPSSQIILLASGYH